ncbi:hypothetical protein PFDG_05515, partial [Plasmodium falciparum Dd2]
MNIEKLNAVKNYVQNFDHKNADESKKNYELFRIICISKFVQLLKSIDIKMVVFDFDLTIIGAHSGKDCSVYNIYIYIYLFIYLYLFIYI